MRYTVHTHRTFHHRITKYLGVLVGAALIATLGLPSAAQAQTPAAPTVKGMGEGTGDGAAPLPQRGWRRGCLVARRQQTGWLSNIQSLAYHGPTRRRCTSIGRYYATSVLSNAIDGE